MPIPPSEPFDLDVDYIRWREERRRRMRLILAVAPAMCGLLLGEISSIFLKNSDQLLIIIVLKYALYGTSAFALLMFYLQTGFKFSAPAISDYAARDTEVESLRNMMEATRSDTERLTRITAEIVEAKDQFSKIGSSVEQLTDVQRSEIASLIQRRIETETATESFTALRDQMLAATKRDSRMEQLSILFKTTVGRLDQEIAALGWRGNLNLVIGIFISVSGLSLLGYVVFGAHLADPTPEALAVYYLPRISLVLFVEVFAYFFLKLYKASLAEIKYFQNEITNVEAKLAALLEATREGCENVMSDVIRSLSVTERNFILRKDETTVDLERARLDKDTVSELGDKLLNVFRIRDK